LGKLELPKFAQPRARDNRRDAANTSLADRGTDPRKMAAILGHTHPVVCSMRLIDHFRRGGRFDPDRAALVQGRRSLSWRDADSLVERIAAAMTSAGIGAGAPIGVFSPNDITAFTAILGIFRLGGIWVPINARNTVIANHHWIGLSRCEVLFYHSSLEAEAQALCPLLSGSALLICIDREDGERSMGDFLSRAGDPAPEPLDDPGILANIFPTGGTTGQSKAASWTLRVWETLIGTFWQCMPIDTQPVHLVAGPMTHAAGVLALCVLARGGTNVIIDRPTPELVIDAIACHRITHLYLPPTVVYNLLDYPGVREGDYGSLKYMVVAASPISPAKLREAMEVFGPVVCQCYGQAEAPMFLTFLSTHDLLAGPSDRWASCGRATLATRLEIMADDGTILGPGEKGEIVARGSLVIPHYLHDPDATQSVTINGWHRTGDIGFQDEAGFFSIVDRLKDMIITGGFNVFSAEVEQIVLEHPAILDCAVIGVPDAKWGEAIKAVVQLREGASLMEGEIVALVRNRLGAVHAPKSVEIWPELPRSPAGKVLKRSIRERFWKDAERAIG
jgi:acyl-CoA synthetase (AMP-forming)/AMP-acid ligase II